MVGKLLSEASGKVGKVFLEVVSLSIVFHERFPNSILLGRT